MREVDIAIVFTPEAWVEHLHRRLTDHGGARVRHLIVDPAVALREPFATLVVSWRWPSLTRGFVAELHERGRTVLGVCDALDESSRDILTRCGVDRIVTSDAPHHEFIEALIVMQHEFASDLGVRPARTEQTQAQPSEPLIAVSGPAGSGASELAIEFGRALRGVVVDCDEVAPSIAPRLGLPLEPNIRTVVDAIEHGLGELFDGVMSSDCGSVEIVGGIANVAGWLQVRAIEVIRSLRSLAQHRAVVADVSSLFEEVGPSSRGRFAVSRSVLHEADAIVAVGVGHPVGIVRLITWIGDLHCLRPGAPIVVVLNRTPPDRARRADLADEIARVLGDTPVFCVPSDAKVDAAMWAGSLVRRGAFTKSVAGAVDAVLDRVDSVRTPTHAGSERSLFSSDVILGAVH